MSDVYYGPSFERLFNNVFKNDQELDKALASGRLFERSSSYIHIAVERGMNVQVEKPHFNTLMDAMEYILKAMA